MAWALGPRLPLGMGLLELVLCLCRMAPHPLGRILGLECKMGMECKMDMGPHALGPSLGLGCMMGKSGLQRHWGSKQCRQEAARGHRHLYHLDTRLRDMD